MAAGSVSRIQCSRSGRPAPSSALGLPLHAAGDDRRPPERQREQRDVEAVRQHEVGAGERGLARRDRPTHDDVGRGALGLEACSEPRGGVLVEPYLREARDRAGADDARRREGEGLRLGGLLGALVRPEREQEPRARRQGVVRRRRVEQVEREVRRDAARAHTHPAELDEAGLIADPQPVGERGLPTDQPREARPERLEGDAGRSGPRTRRAGRSSARGPRRGDRTLGRGALRSGRPAGADKSPGRRPARRGSSRRRRARRARSTCRPARGRAVRGTARRRRGRRARAAREGGAAAAAHASARRRPRCRAASPG